jgi:hypothetical protein
MAAGVFQALPPGAPQVAFLRELQQVQGNRAVARLIQRAAPAHIVSARAAPPVLADLQAFRDRGPRSAGAPGTILSIQRSTGRSANRLLQRCGGEVHEGCSCAEEPELEPVSRTVEPAAGAQPIWRFTDGTPEAPSADLPDGSPFARMDAALLAMLGRSLTGKTFWRWVNDKPTNLGAALDLLAIADVNTLVQLYGRLEKAGLWGFIGTMTGLWSTSSLGITFNETGSIQAGLPEKTFCKDTAVGESYHLGKSCWREMVEPGTPGLHVCVPGEVHIDPHQTVSGKVPGVMVGGPSWVTFGSVCWYSLLNLVDHMQDVEGGRAVNVFTRRGQDYDRIKKQRSRIDGLVAKHPDLATQKPALDALEGRLNAVGVKMKPWAIRGFEGTDGSAEAKEVLDELTAIEAGIVDVEREINAAKAGDAMPPPGARSRYY